MPSVGRTCPAAPASLTDGSGNQGYGKSKPSAHITPQITLAAFPGFLLGSPHSTPCPVPWVCPSAERALPHHFPLMWNIANDKGESVNDGK